MIMGGFVEILLRRNPEFSGLLFYLNFVLAAFHVKTEYGNPRKRGTQIGVTHIGEASTFIDFQKPIW
jgi:hypothetical protein